MNDFFKQDDGCCGQESQPCSCSEQTGIQLMTAVPAQEDEVCCGRPAGPAASAFERPGYRLWHFVDDFKDTSAGPVPIVKTRSDKTDRAGTLSTRLGVNRYDYKVSPGLYCVGNPGKDAPVLVTANYKLSFDGLRRALISMDAWILVLDTRGINVWCAAGKGAFSSDEVVRQIKLTGLDRVVDHRELILPQLSATGVSARRVKKESGFSVVWGPVRANDLKRFLDNGKQADPSMRRVTFSLLERLALVPVEISLVLKPLFWTLLAVFMLSGIGTSLFSVSAAWHRGFMAAGALVTGIVAGAVAVPALLPWIPGRAFSLKGAVTGTIAGLWITAIYWDAAGALELAALFLCTVAGSSYLAMNFTGATPFTSPSGVEKEMRRAILLQAGAVVLAAVMWLAAPFAG